MYHDPDGAAPRVLEYPNLAIFVMHASEAELGLLVFVLMDSTRIPTHLNSRFFIAFSSRKNNSDLDTSTFIMPLAGKPTPLPLPVNTFPHSSPTQVAYDACLILEQRGAWNTLNRDLQKAASEFIMFDMSPLVASCVLGHALVLAPSEDGREALAREINSCYSDPELLAGLAHLYVFGLMRVCAFFSSVNLFSGYLTKLQSTILKVPHLSFHPIRVLGDPSRSL